MREEEEIRNFYEDVLREYDKSAQGGMTPNGTLSTLRDILEWILGETDETPEAADYWVP